MAPHALKIKIPSPVVAVREKTEKTLSRLLDSFCKCLMRTTEENNSQLCNESSDF